MTNILGRVAPLEKLGARGWCAWAVVALLELSSSACRAPTDARPRLTHDEIGCDQRRPLRWGVPTRISVVPKEQRLEMSCSRGTGPLCVIPLEVPMDAQVRLSAASHGFDAALALWARDGQAAELACAVDEPPPTAREARIDAHLPRGAYYLSIAGQARFGEVELFAQLDPLPSPAQLCAAADALHSAQMFRGTTAFGLNRFTSTCPEPSVGPERVHRLTVERPGRVRIVQEAEGEGVLYARPSCESATAGIVCGASFDDRSRALLTARVAPGELFVFSDTPAADQAGNYTLATELIDEPHDAPLAQRCTEFAREAVAGGTFEMDTFTMPSSTEGSCGGHGAPEQAVTVRVTEPSILSARVEDAEFRSVLYVRSHCAGFGSELGCAVLPMAQTPRSGSEADALTVRVGPGDYTVFVDGQQESEMGALTLILKVRTLGAGAQEELER